jgi:hypothetical protein
MSDSGNTSAVCPVCQSNVADGQEAVDCPECRTLYHRECWDYNEGCAVYGCSQTTPARPLDASEVPASYWGREDKQCPSCGQSILAAAVRCRFCGAVFDAQPEDAESYRLHVERQNRAPSYKKKCILLLVAGVLPCSAPLAALVGGIWLARRRGDLKSLPTLYPAMAWIGLASALLQLAAVGFAAALHQALATH